MLTSVGCSTVPEIVTAHHCNWEWLLLRLTEAIPYPVEALYKPLQPASAEKAMDGGGMR